MINFNLYRIPDYKFSNLITNKSFGVDIDLFTAIDELKSNEIISELDTNKLISMFIYSYLVGIQFKSFTISLVSGLSLSVDYNQEWYDKHTSELQNLVYDKSDTLEIKYQKFNEYSELKGVQNGR